MGSLPTLQVDRAYNRERLYPEGPITGTFFLIMQVDGHTTGRAYKQGRLAISFALFPPKEPGPRLSSLH